MQAIIMAGGEGARLRPLTCYTPKPLCPLLGEPVMGYALKLLKTHGAEDIGVTLWYQPQKIRKAFRKGEGYGVRLRYYEEKEPVGTAGSVKLAQKQLTEPFFVLSGDGLTDCDLTAAMAFHRSKKALATLVLKRVSVPLPYGVVLTDGESRITRFIEKPDWKRVFSDLVNTGIYVLEPEIFDYIPDTGMPDFGKDVFPALLAGGLPVYGYETPGYWCDVGDQRAYLQAQRDLLSGGVALPHPAGAHPTAHIDPKARLEGDCLIGPEAVIGPGAVVRDSVIGRKAQVRSGARVEGSCLWPEAVVQEKTEISGSVLCDGAVARPGAALGEGCALGQRAVAGAGAQLMPGVRVWPHFRVAPGAVADRHVTSGDWSAPQWTDRGAQCDTAEGVCSLCGAYIKVTGAKRVLTACGGAFSLEALADGALSAAGAKVYSAGEMTEPMARCVIRALRLDGGVFSSQQTLSFLDGAGLPLSPKLTGAMDQSVLKEGSPMLFARPAVPMPLRGAEEMYLAHALPPQEGRPLFSPVAVFSDSNLLLRLAEEGLGRLGARDARFSPVANPELRPGETGFLLSPDGKELTVLTARGNLSREEKTMLLLSLHYGRFGRLYDLEGTPRAAGQIGPLKMADDQEAGCLSQRALLEDGLRGLFLIAAALKAGPLEELMRRVPETHILTREIPCADRDKGRILHTLCGQTNQPRTLGEGVRIEHEKGFATIVPDPHRSLVRVMSEAGKSEFAQELCDFYLTRIQKLTENTSL